MSKVNSAANAKNVYMFQDIISAKNPRVEIEKKTKTKKEASSRKRRDYKDGAVFQRSDGRWEARYKDKYFNGGKPHSLYGKTEKEVKKKLRLFKEQVQGGVIVDGMTTDTTEEYMTRWLYSVKQNKLKPKSFDRLETTLQNQVFPQFGWMLFAKMTTDDIQDGINELYEQGLSHSTVVKAFQALNNCFNWSLRKYPSPVKYNPCNGVALKTTEERQVSDIEFLTPREAERIEYVATHEVKVQGKWPVKYRLGWAIVLVLRTGIRLGELSALKWKEHIDFKKGTISIVSNLVDIIDRDPNAKSKHKLVIQDTTKSKSSRRILHMSKRSREALEELYKVTGKSEYVISTKSGKCVSPRNMDRLVKNVCRVAGVLCPGLASLDR